MLPILSLTAAMFLTVTPVQPNLAVSAISPARKIDVSPFPIQIAESDASSAATAESAQDADESADRDDDNDDNDNNDDQNQTAGQQNGADQSDEQQNAGN